MTARLSAITVSSSTTRTLNVSASVGIWTTPAGPLSFRTKYKAWATARQHARGRIGEGRNEKITGVSGRVWTSGPKKKHNGAIESAGAPSPGHAQEPAATLGPGGHGGIPA